MLTVPEVIFVIQIFEAPANLSEEKRTSFRIFLDARSYYYSNTKETMPKVHELHYKGQLCKTPENLSGEN